MAKMIIVSNAALAESRRITAEIGPQTAKRAKAEFPKTGALIAVSTLIAVVDLWSALQMVLKDEHGALDEELSKRIWDFAMAEAKTCVDSWQILVKKYGVEVDDNGQPIQKTEIKKTEVQTAEGGEADEEKTGNAH